VHVHLELPHHRRQRTAARADRALDERTGRAAGERAGEHGRARPERPGGRRRRAAAAVLLCAAGCAPAPNPGPPAVPPPAVERREATIANGFIELTVHVPREPAGPKATIINPVFDRDALLAAGAVLVEWRERWDLLAGFAPRHPAAPPTPERPVGKWLLAAPSPKTVGEGWFGFIGWDAKEAVPRIVDHLLRDADVDPNRLAIAGNSTTGFTALEALAYEPRLRAAAVVSACGDYLDFLRHSTLAMNGAPLDLDPGYARRLRERQPIAHPERLTHAAVLMVNGRDDPAVPFRCARRTATVLRRAYARAGVRERFRFVALATRGHRIDDTGRREILAWWRRWLFLPLPAPSATAGHAPADARRTPNVPSAFATSAPSA